MARYSIGIGELAALMKEEGAEKLQAMGGITGLMRTLEVDANLGVSSNDVDDRRKFFGENRIPERPPTTYLQYLWSALGDFTIRLLCFCAVISILVAVFFQHEEELSWLDGVAILVTVILVCNIQAIQDWTKERSFRRLNADVNFVTLPVLRDGQKKDVPRFDVVVGDLIHVGVGDILEADGVLVRGEDVQCDESALTGEPEEIKKDVDDAPFLFAGSSVKNGSGVYVAVAVGVNSMAGTITALVRGQKVAKGGEGADEQEAAQQEEAEESDGSVLRQKLDDMVGKIAYFAFGSATIATVVILARYIYTSYIVDQRDWSMKKDPDEILDAVVSGIAIVVVAVPEGLPLAVTLALSLSMRKMQKENNLVKHLDATETMGSATTICSDKTGTLTQNRMTVVRACIAGREFAQAEGQQTCGKQLQEAGLVSRDLQTRMCENICLTKTAGAEIKWDQELDRWDQYGDKTDCALLAFSQDLGFMYKAIRDRGHYQVKDRHGNTVLGLKMYPFSSSRKRAGQVVPLTDDPRGPCRLYIKGASEIVLKLCSFETQLNDQIAPLTLQRREEIFSGVVEKLANMAMRTITLAYRDFAMAPDWDEELESNDAYQLTGLTSKTFKAETGLTLLGVMGIHDPIRDGVPRAIVQCNGAGVDVRMVTGDHKATAIAIAKECGILRRGIDYGDDPMAPLVHRYTAMTGEEFRNKVLDKGRINQEEFDDVWPYLRVLARSSPEDKHTLVSGLCESVLYKSASSKQVHIYPDRQIVAVTGDGTNDAPALRRADVGFAMKGGTRVAQDAADIILVDDNFESVVNACKWGRNVYDSIAKFLQFQLTVNISAVSISLIGACTVKRVPLSVVQMLWVNLIMDSLGALALAAEPPTDDLLTRAPYGRNKSLISYEMWCNMLGQSMYQLIVLSILLFGAAGDGCWDNVNGNDECTVWPKGGILDIESGIGRDLHDPPTDHYTIIFNAFVLMQLFNWINCRKLYHEYNLFSGIHRNLPFCIIWVTCLIVQILLVQVAALGGGEGENKALKTKGLTLEQWILCSVCGVFSILWQLAIVTVGRVLKPMLKHEQEWKPLTAREASLPEKMGASGRDVDGVADEALGVDDVTLRIDMPRQGGGNANANENGGGVARDNSGRLNPQRLNYDEQTIKEFSRQGSRVQERNMARVGVEVKLSAKKSTP